MIRALADTVLIIHAMYVGFVVVGLVVILWGGLRGWRWVRGRVFRGLHLVAIGLVIVQAWLGVTCPLTTLENRLRQQSSQDLYVHGFVQDMVGDLLFWDFEPWVFTVAYTAFGALVLASWVGVPIRWRSRSQSTLHSL